VSDKRYAVRGRQEAVGTGGHETACGRGTGYAAELSARGLPVKK